MTSTVNKLTKGVESLEGMISRQSKNLIKLHHSPVISIQSYKQLKVALYLNRANLEATKDRLTENLRALEIAKEELKMAMAIKVERRGVIIPWRQMP